MNKSNNSHQMTDDKDAISYTSRPTKDQTDQFEKNDKEKKAKAKPNLPKGVKRNLEADIDWLPTSQPETSNRRGGNDVENGKASLCKKQIFSQS